MTTQKTIQSINAEIFELISKRTDIDAAYHLDEDNKYESADEIRDILNDAGCFDTEIIYYSKAMDFLMENDNSLRRSMEIASDMGYEAKDINSEILASLLASEVSREDFSEIESDIEDFINEYPEEDEDEETEED